jgi:hypothetical protein
VSQRFIEGGNQTNTMQIGQYTIQQTATNIPLAGTVLTTGVKVHRCPSDVGRDVNTSRMSALGASSTSNYVGANSAFDVEIFPLGARAHKGLFGADEAFAFRDMLDGTSNTIALGERRYQVKMRGGAINGLIYEVGAALVWGVRSSSGTSSANPAPTPGLMALTSFNPGGPLGTAIGADNLADVLGGGYGGINQNGKVGTVSATNPSVIRRGFSSQHPGGAQFALGDGSVRFIAETINHTPQLYTGPTSVPNSTFEYLLGAADGNQVGNF